MSEFVQGMLIALVPALVVSVVTAYITVRLSIKQFCSQKWWEKKAEAYSQILEHLSYLQFYLGQRFNEAVGLEMLEDKDRKSLSEGYSKAKEAVTKAAAIGAYIVTEDTAIVLESLLHELGKKDSKGDWVGDIDRWYGLVKDCIVKLREYAKADLKVGLRKNHGFGGSSLRRRFLELICKDSMSKKV